MCIGLSDCIEFKSKKIHDYEHCMSIQLSVESINFHIRKSLKVNHTMTSSLL